MPVKRKWLLAIVGVFSVLILTLLAVTLGTGPESRATPDARSSPSDLSVSQPSPAAAGVPSALVTARASVTKNPGAAHATAKPGTAKSSPVTPESPGGNALSSGGPITAGDSKANCVIPSLPDGILSQSLLDGITATTGVAYSCAGFFNNPAPTWAEWESPAPFRSAQYGWIPWLAASPAHRAVMSMDLIPQAVSDNSDPLTWEQACASGDYDQYATALAEDLVSAGGGGVVIRLGTEANGT